MPKLIESLQSGLLFIEFLGNRLSGKRKDELRNIYNEDFRLRNGVKHPNFSTVLYALRTFNQVDIVKGKIYRNGHFEVRVSSDQAKIIGPQQTHRHAAQKSTTKESPGRFTTKSDPGVTPKKKQASDQQKIIGPHPTNVQGTQKSTAKESPGCSTTKTEPGMSPKKKQASDILQKMKTNRKEMMADREGIQITSVPKGSDGVVHHTVAFEMQPFVIKFSILNNGSGMVYFTKYTVLDRVRCYNLKDVRKVTKANPLPLCPGESYDVVLSYFLNECGYFPATVYFEFQLDLPKPVTFCIVREIKAVVQTSLGAELGPVAPYKPYPKVKPKRPIKEVVEGIPPAGSFQSVTTTVKLGDYKCPGYLRVLAYRNMDDSEDLLPPARQQLSQVKKLLESALDMKNYSLRFHLLLHLEEIQMEEDIKNYNLYNQTMTKDQGNRKLLVLKVPGVAENRPSVLRGDCLWVRKSGNTTSSMTVYKGYVHRVELDRVKLGFANRLLDIFITNMTFDVEFTFNRLTLKLQHRAVDLAVKHKLKEVLFPSETASKKVSVAELSMLNHRIENNPEQRKAVQHIIAASSKPAPYIVFGPPGTGKTITMVEAINQVIKADPSAHILACAPSNSACDLLCERLKPHMSTFELYRMYASSRDPNSVPKDLRKYCNWDEKQDCFVFPEKEILMKYKVMVTTLFTAGRFVTGGVPVGHFSYVFVDEAGQAEEPQCIIAVAGLLCPEKGQLVLAGDPKQLGPIIRSPYAIQHGLGLSLLERLMNRKPYQDLDSRFVTKLLQNYRSHAAILKIPNEEFYNNELQVSASQEEREIYCNWEALPQKGFPVIFHGVLGKDEREGNSPSFFNVSEIETLVAYLNRLEQTQGKKGLPKLSAKDIGIITPYRKQVEKIQKALKSLKTLSHWNDPKELKVGSVEEFQGQERNIIIISTVRSSLSYVKMDTDFNIGFLSNEKRFNVALTRAKSLLIVIGNPVILRKDPLWKKFINYCVEMNGYVGIDFKNVEEEDLFEAKMKALKITDSEEPVGEMSALQLHVDPGWKSEI
ncbi:putative helicase mov-10-B.1 isoform X1 [Poecilia formosa]|uniref:putative helicase mov-10-B.1 isoform X1 n=1 Tax=Poecilia formosa TaxID=48698 RepID=UPI0004442A30|nr:PREDICTED: putative helicase mov-10-B.1 isoform X1 [Poecilia formosa]XP_007546937.1 PREDICTED: putative helicase mov-10-B.1 isoform X1 [Poecilia formosa]